MDDKVFTVSSYNGYSVSLSSSTFNEHILPQHGEMIGSDPIISSTISHPDVVFQDVDYNNREDYYKNVSPSNKKMKVVVEYTEDETNTTIGEVVTAFYTKRIKEKSEALYESKE